MPGGGNSRDGQRVFGDQADYEALERLLDITRRDSDHSGRVADFLLLAANAELHLAIRRVVQEYAAASWGPL
jgi:hypothetical protein